ncbi:MAG: hypothetical protein ACR2NL_00630, partial [Acidimicrobiia bacterium]
MAETWTRNSRTSLAVILATSVLAVIPAGPAFAADPPPVFRVSVASNGAQARISSSDDPSISADGTRIAFESGATNLVAGDTNNKDDIFVHDTATGATTRVSVATDGTQGNNHSRLGNISSDGTKVAFISWSSNLIAGDTNIREDVFVHDLTTSTTSRVSLAHDDAEVVATYVSTISISGDGTRIAWVSDRSQFVLNDTNAKLDVFVRDTVAGTTTRVSVASNGTEGNFGSDSPSLSSDGNFVGFRSEARNLVAGDLNLYRDVFVHELATGTTTRVSVTDGEAEATGGESGIPSLNADGSKIAFESRATNLVAGDTNNAIDVYLRDTTAGTTTRVSVADDGSQASDSSGAAAINADGTKVAFHSTATNLVDGDTNIAVDVFLRDLTAGTTTRLSTTDTGAQAAGVSDAPSINASGTRIAFNSRVALVSADTNGTDDAYVAATDCCIDTDGDGLTDGEEADLGTNPALADTDGDGLDDGDEVNTHGTDPLLADMDGDGIDDGDEIGAARDPSEPPAQVALFNPATGEWNLRSANGSTTSFYYGNPGDTPLMGDWDCDGIDTVGMFRPSNGFAYLRNSNTFGVGEIEFFFGIAGDIPIVGDWDGDGCDSLGVFRGGHVFLTNALETAFADIDFWFGIPGDSPFTGDFDNDGLTEVGLFRESTGFAYMRWDYTSGVADHDFFFGIPGDQIIAGDWNNNYQETVGIWRSSAATFY